jgi:hypothetical protein
MATVNFSVPEEVKKEFLETFADENRSAIVADLMRQAIAKRRLAQQRAAAVEALLDLRRRMPAASDHQVAVARNAGRR